MDELVLIRPALAHKSSAEEFKREFFSCGEQVINGSALLDQMKFGEWLENVEKNRNPETVRKDWVVADEKCGGVLAETKTYVDGRPMNVYWITNI